MDGLLLAPTSDSQSISPVWSSGFGFLWPWGVVTAGPRDWRTPEKNPATARQSEMCTLGWRTNEVPVVTSKCHSTGTKPQAAGKHRSACRTSRSFAKGMIGYLSIPFISMELPIFYTPPLHLSRCPFITFEPSPNMNHLLSFLRLLFTVRCVT